MSENQRQTKRVMLGTLKYEFDGPIEKAIKMLQEIAAKHPTAELEYEDHSGAYDPAPNYCVGFFEHRPETDEEMARRLAEEEARQKKQDAYDRAVWERLNAKFGLKKES